MIIYRSHILVLFVLLMLPLFGSNSLQAQNLTIQKENSSLAIEGHSNVNQFRCEANDYQTIIERTSTEDQPDEQLENQLRVNISIEVDGFECGRSRMNRDLRNALKSDQHPTIEFEYISTREMTYDDSSDRYTLQVNGNLTVAGTTNEIEFEINGTLLNGNLIRAKGEKLILMSDYNIEPPVALFGLVKVQEELTVRFDLMAEVNNQFPSQ